MLKNYILTSFRNLKRHKTYTFLNLFGLAMSIGCVLVIYRYIEYETSYDKHHSKYDKIYRLTRQEQSSTGGIQLASGVPHPIAEALRTDFPELKDIARTHYAWGDQVRVVHDDGTQDIYEEDGVVYTDPELFNIFDYTILAGDPKATLAEVDQVVITRSLAEKYFDLKSDQVHKAIGKRVILANAVDLEVGAIIEDSPPTTDLPFTFMVTYQSQNKTNPFFDDGKRFNSISSATHCYMLLGEYDEPQNYTNQFPAFIEKYFGEGESEQLKLKLLPLSEMHYNPDVEIYSSGHLDPVTKWSLIIIAIFLLIAACINFINLATAQAVNRAKEIGIRKVLGSGRSSLVWQFLGETYLITFLAILIGLVFAELLLINLEDIIGFQLKLELLSNPGALVFLLVLSLVVTLLAGFYPAVLLSGMNPILAMKHKISAQKHTGGLSIRRFLVILQFAISQVLIIGTLIINSQMNYVLNKDLGFDKEAIVSVFIPEPSEEVSNNIRNQLASNPLVEEVSFMIGGPTASSNNHSNMDYAPLDLEEPANGNFKAVDEHYIDLFGLKLIAGRNFRNSDSLNVTVVNRKVTQWMGFEDPAQAIGEKLSTGYSGDKTIVGVIEDFHAYTLYRPMDFVLLVNDPRLRYFMGVKLAKAGGNYNDLDKVLSDIESAWKAHFPNFIYNYEFYDQSLAERYEGVKDSNHLLTLFSVIAIFIGCLGLYGLIAFMANQKSKEIGVRKVLGASAANILTIFSKELILLLFVAFIGAAPLSFWLMSEWLSDFPYKTEMRLWEFVLALGLTFLVAIITMSVRAGKAALANPVDSLKDE